MAPRAGSTSTPSTTKCTLNGNRRGCICDRGRQVCASTTVKHHSVLTAHPFVFAGSGLTAHTIIQGLCELSGIQDISANIVGSTNRLNIVRSWFKAIQQQRYGACHSECCEEAVTLSQPPMAQNCGRSVPGAGQEHCNVPAIGQGYRLIAVNANHC